MTYIAMLTRHAVIHLMKYQGKNVF